VIEHQSAEIEPPDAFEALEEALKADDEPAADNVVPLSPKTAV
jgi:hypothetical protein